MRIGEGHAEVLRERLRGEVLRLGPDPLAASMGLTYAMRAPAQRRCTRGRRREQQPAVCKGAVVEVDRELLYHSPPAAAATLARAERSLLR